jgi:hypothetical protein
MEMLFRKLLLFTKSKLSRRLIQYIHIEYSYLEANSCIRKINMRLNVAAKNPPYVGTYCDMTPESRSTSS